MVFEYIFVDDCCHGVCVSVCEGKSELLCYVLFVAVVAPRVQVLVPRRDTAMLRSVNLLGSSGETQW